MADAIYALLSYPAISQIAVRKGLDEVNSLKWDNAASQVKEVYSKIIL
jgi:hypothetical protein